MGLKLRLPTSIVAEKARSTGTYPGWARILFEFPARGDMAPVKFTVVRGKEGRQTVLPPEELLTRCSRMAEKLSDSGSLLVGDNNRILFSPNDYGAQYRLVDTAANSSAAQSRSGGWRALLSAVPRRSARNGMGDDGMKAEWARRSKEGKPSMAMSNFDYAAMLTATILLGNVAMRVARSSNGTAEPERHNCPEAAQYIRRNTAKLDAVKKLSVPLAALACR